MQEKLEKGFSSVDQQDSALLFMQGSASVKDFFRIFIWEFGFKKIYLPWLQQCCQSPIRLFLLNLCNSWQIVDIANSPGSLCKKFGPKQLCKLGTKIAFFIFSLLHMICHFSICWICTLYGPFILQPLF